MAKAIGYFIHPLPLLSVLILAFNDHYLKQHHPSFLTGKLSDFAGVFFFPLFLCACLDLVKWVLGARGQRLVMSHVLAAMVLTDLIFVGVKCVPQITLVYLRLLQTLGFPSRVTPDWTDLSALVMNFATWSYAKSQLKNNARDFSHESGTSIDQ